MYGQLDSVEKRAAEFADRSSRAGEPAWSVKFNLLRAETLINLGRAQDASKLLDGLDPNRAGVKWKILKAQIAAKPADFNQLLTEARQSATPAESVQIDLVEASRFAGARQWPNAEARFERGERAAARERDVYRQASALIGLTYCRLHQFRPDDCVQFGERALALSKQINARRILARAHDNIGICRGQLGDFDRALDNRSEAIRLFTELGENVNLANAIGEQGNLFFWQNRPEQASASYRKTFEMLKTQKNDPKRLVIWARNTATAEMTLRNWEEAKRWNQLARDLAHQAEDVTEEDLRDLNDGFIAENTSLEAKAEQIYKRLATTSPNPAVRWRATSNLALLHLRQGRRAAATREFESALALINTTRAGLLRTESKITFISRLISFYREYVGALVDQKRDAEALQVVESSKARVLAERLERTAKPAALVDLQRLASEKKSVLLSFWLTPNRSHVWLIDAKRMRRFTLPGSSEIEPLIDSFQKKTQDLEPDNAAGPKLWNALLSQVAPLIPKGSRVIAEVDGALHAINLESLPAPDGHLWVDDVELSVAPALSLLTDAPREESKSLLAIGAPDEVDKDFPRLARAGEELTAIASNFTAEQKAVYSGSRATPEAYRSAVPGKFSIIHFAAHAQSNRVAPLESAVVLSRQGDAYKLYAKEVIDIPIRARLVTVSACRSAGARTYAGEGLIGFAWAFLQAGAQSVIAGLWDVSDSSTEPLMTELYSRIAAGDPPATALHKAKLKLRSGKFSRPYYWAPFQIYVRSL